jgi:hypothetical protein
MRTIPFESIIVSIVIEQGKELAALRRTVERLEERVLVVGAGEVVRD